MGVSACAGAWYAGETLQTTNAVNEHNEREKDGLKPAGGDGGEPV